MSKIKNLIVLAALLLNVFMIGAQTVCPKREFRGAWIQCVNGQFQGMPVEAMKRTLVGQLDKLEEALMLFISRHTNRGAVF